MSNNLASKRDNKSGTKRIRAKVNMSLYRRRDVCRSIKDTTSTLHLFAFSPSLSRFIRACTRTNASFPTSLLKRNDVLLLRLWTCQSKLVHSGNVVDSLLHTANNCIVFTLSLQINIPAQSATFGQNGKVRKGTKFRSHFAWLEKVLNEIFSEGCLK